MTPSRVLMTTDTVGGVWHYSLELARELSRFDVQVELATMGPPPSSAQTQAAHAIPGLHLHTSSYKLEWMEDPWQDVDQAEAWLQRLERELKPDVLHYNHFGRAQICAAVPLIVVAHSDVWSWWNAVHKADPPGAWNEYRRRVRASLRSADLVVSPTRHALEQMRLHYGEFAPAIVIPNGKDSPPSRARVKEEIILTVGRLWDEAKNVALLDEIAGSVSWPILAAGPSRAPGGHGPALSHIECVGERPPHELEQLQARAAIYAHPAKYEPFGLSILEAARNGCALLLADIPTLRENWEGAALFANPCRADHWRQSLNSLIRNAGLRRELGQRALARAERFQAPAMAVRYFTEYRRLLSLRHQGCPA